MLVVLVNGLPGAGKTTLAHRLSRALCLPLFSKDAVKETMADVMGVRGHTAAWSRLLGAAASEALWTLLGQSRVGAVIESPYLADRRAIVQRGLQRAGVDPGDLHEVWCEVPFALARARFEARAGVRHPIHGDDRDKDAEWAAWRTLAEPLGFGTTHRIDTSVPVSEVALRALAAEIRAQSPTATDARWPPVKTSHCDA